MLWLESPFHQGACKSLAEMKSQCVSVHLVIFVSNDCNTIGLWAAEIFLESLVIFPEGTTQIHW
jgi:hypothetical protein